eukprot:TRINITY_DN46949_c0_g1_i1.p1 TRINITY_DN46949_c0_g1~~TRINITY_DN46949_c0_g1_i1.p1  ORF type:complete len:310 (+),score=98.13 TRINITY_DN46949_c0_g1_i1:141-932(+)
MFPNGMGFDGLKIKEELIKRTGSEDPQVWEAAVKTMAEENKIKQEKEAAEKAAADAAAQAALEEAGGVKQLRDSDFEEGGVVAKGHWAVMFHAPWCGHCRALAPVWEDVAAAGKPHGVRVGKLDCTLFVSKCAKLKVEAYPTLAVFERGPVETGRVTGGKPLSDLLFLVEEGSGEPLARDMLPFGAYAGMRAKRSYHRAVSTVESVGGRPGLVLAAVAAAVAIALPIFGSLVGCLYCCAGCLRSYRISRQEELRQQRAAKKRD